MDDLASLITPSLLRDMARARVPWSPTEPISPKAMVLNSFGTLADSAFAIRARRALPVLRALSRRHGPTHIPDLTIYLPPSSDPSFPEQAFGLHVLLDQPSRFLFRGIDARWTSYFDRLVRAQFARHLELPAPLRPWARERWSGATLEYWMLVQWMFASAATHSESVRDQELSVALTEERRVALEAATGERDPWRDEDESVRNDVYAFPRVVTSVDLEREWTLAEAAFLFCMVTDIHKPIIDRYGRYPYRNAIEGRVSSEEERDWLEKVDHFGEASPEVAKRVREDIEKGRWTPLGEEDDEDLTGSSLAIDIKSSD